LQDLYTQTLDDGDVVFREEDEGNCAYIVEMGSVVIWSHRDGDRIELAVIRPGSIFGEMSVIDNVPRSANATARGKTRLRVVTAEHMRLRIRESDPVVRLMVQVLLNRFRNEQRMHRGRLTSPSFDDMTPPGTVGPRLVDDTTGAIAKMKMETSIQEALEKEQLELWYQPIVRLKDYQIMGFEALIRWRHPTRGMIPPFEFIELAEETQLIVPIGKWVFDRACRDLVALRANDSRGLDPVFVNVNFSGRQVLEDSLIPAMTETIEAHGLTPRDVKVEVTEGVFIDARATLGWMKRLEAAGFRVVLDDFGTGYSSLAYLRKFPISTLKVDKSFVWEMLEDDSAFAIVEAIVQMARALRMDVVAEGVETAAHRDALRRMGCSCAQGYFFARPVPAEEAIGLLRSGLPEASAG
jgi:EAL domain-containing protein (putative c-di-GMP-specific phosphodiesterase class I)